MRSTDVGHSWGVSAQLCDGLLVCKQKLRERHVFPLGAAQLYQLHSVRVWNLAIATVSPDAAADHSAKVHAVGSGDKQGC